MRLLFYYNQACCRRGKPCPANTAPVWPQGLQQQLLMLTGAGTASAPETRTSANAATGFCGLSASSRVSYPLLAPIRMSACNRQGYTPLTMKRKLKGLHRAACIKQADYHSQSPPHCRAEGKPARDKERSSKSAYLWGLIKTQLRCCIVSLPVTPGCSTQLFEQENKIKLPVLPR